MNQVETSSVSKPAIPGFIYGYAHAMESVNEMVAEIAPTGIPVLIMG